MDDLDFDNLKTISVDLEKLNDVTSKDAVKKTVHNKVNTKVNYLENKILDASTLIQTNQYDTDKQSLEEKNGEVENRIHDLAVSSKKHL